MLHGVCCCRCCCAVLFVFCCCVLLFRCLLFAGYLGLVVDCWLLVVFAVDRKWLFVVVYCSLDVVACWLLLVVYCCLMCCCWSLCVVG